MTSYVTRETITQRLALAEQDEESVLLGGTIRLRELTRAAFKDAARWATSTDLIDRERARGARLVLAAREALNQDDALRLGDLVRAALAQYAIGAPEDATDADRWNAALLAASWIDVATGKPVVTREEILAWPARAPLREEVWRLAQCVLDISEVGPGPLKSSDPTPDAE